MVRYRINVDSTATDLRLNEFPVPPILRSAYDGSGRFVSTGAAIQPVVCTVCAVTNDI